MILFKQYDAKPYEKISVFLIQYSFQLCWDSKTTVNHVVFYRYSYRLDAYRSEKKGTSSGSIACKGKLAASVLLKLHE